MTASFAAVVSEDSMVTATSRSVGPLSLATMYFWRVRAINTGGASEFSPIWQFGTIRTTSVEKLVSDIPSHYFLGQNYPNPFNPSTTIHYSLSKPGYVSLTIHNNLGQTMGTLVEQHQEAGEYRLRWDALDIPSGIYFYRLQTGEFRDTKRMILLK